MLRLVLGLLFLGVCRCSGNVLGKGRGREGSRDDVEESTCLYTGDGEEERSKRKGQEGRNNRKKDIEKSIVSYRR